MMSFEEACSLCDEIMEFLLSCGGVYSSITPETEGKILDCIVTNQFCIRRDGNGSIIHALFFWKVLKQDIAIILRGERPQEIHGGDTLFVIEHGSKSDHLRDIIKELRMICGSNITGVFWNHKQQGYKLFMRQKGVRA